MSIVKRVTVCGLALVLALMQIRATEAQDRPPNQGPGGPRGQSQQQEQHTAQTRGGSTAAGATATPTPPRAGVRTQASGQVGAAVAPSVTVNQAAGQSDPTSSQPINFTVIFSQPVTDFSSGDV